MEDTDDLSICQFHAPMKIWVRNIPGTKNEPSPFGCDSALAYWRAKSGQEALQCMALDPHKNADGKDADIKEIVGAHVRVKGIQCKDNEAWIVPLCKHCNSDERDTDICLPKGVILVPVKLSRNYTVKWRG